MEVSINNRREYSYGARYVGKEIIIGIDSSKTNSALAIRDETGEILDIIELNGTNDGTSQEDVLQLCQQERKTLKVLFSGSIPKIVGIENIITKKSEDVKYSGGITHHMSRFKITSIFFNFIFFFQEAFNITPELINNQEWKAGTLPEEFRRRTHDKGSLDYFKSIHSKYGGYTDDATDAICISQYLCQKHDISKAKRIKEPEACKYDYEMCLLSVPESLKYKTDEFLYNNMMSIKQNATVMSNHIEQGVIASAGIKTADLLLDDIYTYCKGAFNTREDSVVLLVWRVV